MTTRKEYMSSNTGKTDVERTALYRAYYAQLVNAATVAHVVRCIGTKRLLASTDSDNLNDIPLKEWDRAAIGMPKATTFAALEDFSTPAGLVSIAKEAAQQWLATNRPEGMRRWRIEFNGREAGALGVTYRIVKEVEAPTADAAKLKLYDTHEHIMVSSIADITDSAE